MKSLKNQKGIILIEAILALGIIIVVMTALVTALVASISSSNFSKDQSLATGYAQEGLELARNLKDSDYEAFTELTSGIDYCLGENQTEISDEVDPENCPDIDGKFTRSIYIDSDGQNRDDENMCGANSYFVASTVAWADSKCRNGDSCHNVELNSCFVNLYQINPLN